MAGNIRLEIVTPSTDVVNEDAQIVMAPGSMGEFGVLTGHTPFMTSLKVGDIRYVDSNGTERHVFVSGGFAEALPEKVTVLAESAERRSDIDAERAQSALTRAEKRLAESSNTLDVIRAKAALARAIMRVQMASKKGA
ncbi:MAG: ATP synthase epsilon chain (EC 3.6.3.14) [Olavius algarvensis Delta 4 endosymbiont]|nr:MAG: ATP synthase epsilon chain (EC 3.6.3.14) [Olavius algarvensis Delta 4 endosymbiont]